MLELTHGIDIEASIKRKIDESTAVSKRFFEDNTAKISLLSQDIASRFNQGARLFCFGNGGSACDALHLAVEFAHPVFEKRKALPVISLNANIPLITAIANDNDFSIAYSKQLELLAKENDIALMFSTSGLSPNLVAAASAARKIGMLTVACLGKDGGKVQSLCDVSFVVPSFSVHRIQEVHVQLLHVLWDSIHLYLGEEDII